VNRQNRIYIFGIGLRTQLVIAIIISLGARPRCAFRTQPIGNRLLDNGTLEEARVVAHVQRGSIGERELAKILFGDEAFSTMSNASGITLRNQAHQSSRASRG
jgi:hypothetical protein